MHKMLLKNAAQLLTMSGAAPDGISIISNGWLYAEDGLIAAVGTRAEVMCVAGSEAEMDTVVDASGKVVLPGFVDCHTHVMFGGSRVREYTVKMTDDDPATLERLGIKTGIYASVDMTLGAGPSALTEQTEKRMRSMLLHGTTTLESKSGYALETNAELMMLELNRYLSRRLPMDIRSTFLGAHGWPQNMEKTHYIDVLTKEMIPLVAERGLAEYCDIWCDDGHYTAAESEQVLRCGETHGLIPRIHTDAYSYIGGSDLAADMHMASADHLNYTPESVLPKLAAAGVVGVLLPGIEFAVKHPKPFRVRPMLDAGMTVALATNCCPGCWAESMQFILILACRQYAMSPAEAIYAATRGGAGALRLDDRGVLAPGARADLQVWDTDTFEDVIYRYGHNHVELVITGGRIAAQNGKVVFRAEMQE